MDHYAKPQYYGAMKSGDLEHWQDILKELSFATAVRHGTVLRVAESVVKAIAKNAPQR